MKHTREPYVEPRWKKHWSTFELAMTRRLSAGHAQYGDGSFDRQVPDLIREIDEELMDIVGWAYIVWCRLQDLKERAALADPPPDNAA